MQNNRLKEEYLVMEVPELQEKILAGVRAKKTGHPRQKLRPAAVVAVAVMVAVLAVTAGAVANGVLRLQYGSYYKFLDGDGKIVQPTGFHMADSVDVPLSETVLANIMPYEYLYDEDETCFHTTDPVGMEAFIGRAMHMPECLTEEAEGYRLWAYGTPVSIAIADSLQDGKVGFAFYRYADAVYQLRVQGTTVSEVRSRIETILDTVG